MSRVCSVCEEPIPDAGTICHGDARRLAFTLRDVPSLVIELDTTITRRARVAHRSGPGGSSELDPVRVPFHEGASKALDDLRVSLRGWAENLADENGYQVSTKGQVHLGYFAVFLSARMSEVRMKDWAPDMFDEVSDAVRRARRAIDAPPDLVFMGRCTAERPDGDSRVLVVCGDELWCPADATEVRCWTCSATHARDELLTHYTGLAADVTAPAPVIARALTAQGQPLEVMRIYQWKRRGKLAPVGKDPVTQNDLYRLGDVADVLAAMERKTPAGVLGKRKGSK
jgi:hypothetical protein